MIYASITLGLWLFSHVENTLGLLQSANKNSPVGISSQNKADTSGPGVLYPIRAIKTLPLPDEGSRELLKHNREDLPRMQCCPGSPRPKLSSCGEETETRFIAGRRRAGITIICCSTVFRLNQHQSSANRADTQLNYIPCSLTNKTKRIDFGLWRRVINVTECGDDWHTHTHVMLLSSAGHTAANTTVYRWC